MFSFIKTLLGKREREPSAQEIIDEANAIVARYRERDLALMRQAGFDLTGEEFDKLKGSDDEDDEGLSEELAEAFVSAIFDRRNDPLSAVPVGTFEFIAIDVETATRDSATICQIGIACVQGDNIQTFVTLIDPQTPVESRNYAVHQLDDDDLAGMPTFSEAITALRPLLDQHLLVQHSNFDRVAIAGACDRSNLPRLTAIWGDSINAAKQAWPELKSSGGFGLRNIADTLGIEFSHHDAGEDARACAQTVILARQATGLTVKALVTSPCRGAGHRFHQRCPARQTLWARSQVAVRFSPAR
ncbi:exonuclease domain-containing protein [Paracoccus cavernae]|uniref:Exonuclease domain-containing protein n=1 Tax=Paracoccus cavernae TaxID=1571207 RepID=A0ABT8D9G8_9RHOB|nr:exonuclease domain-containing protein [Paracoccus cavernae]